MLGWGLWAVLRMKKKDKQDGFRCGLCVSGIKYIL